MPARRFGKYDVLARLATGGAANIFLARQGGAAGFHKLVCLKTLLPERAQDADFVAMFLDEARLAARLNHPNCVQIYDLGRVRSSYYISMEYIFGETLWNLLATVSRLRTPLPPTHVAAIVASVCDGLHHAHELKDSQGRAYNLVHRDVSPQNIMVSFEGQTKVLDFGIAKAETGRAATIAGIVKGKFSYMSPEQITGGQVDRRSDVYSLGIVLFECLASRRLYRGDTPEEIARLILEHRAPRLRDVVPETPPALDQICARALTRHPGKRFQTAQEMGEQLREYLDQVRYAHSSGVIAKLVEERFRQSLPERRKVFEEALAGTHDEAELLRVLDARPVRTIDLFAGDEAEAEEAGAGSAPPVLVVPEDGTELERATEQENEQDEIRTALPSARREGPGWRVELEGAAEVPEALRVADASTLDAPGSDGSDDATRLDADSVEEMLGAPGAEGTLEDAATAGPEGPTRVDLDSVAESPRAFLPGGEEVNTGLTEPREQGEALAQALAELDDTMEPPRALRGRGASAVRQRKEALNAPTSPTAVEPEADPLEATVRKESGHVRAGGSLDSAVLLEVESTPGGPSPHSRPVTPATRPENVPFVTGPVLVRPATQDVIPRSVERTPPPERVLGPALPASALTPAAALATPSPIEPAVVVSPVARYGPLAVLGALGVGLAAGVLVGLLLARWFWLEPTPIPAVIQPRE